MTHWHAGWNLPGCLPEMEPATFDTEDEAEEFISDEQGFAEEMQLEGYVYWIEPCTEDHGDTGRRPQGETAS